MKFKLVIILSFLFLELYAQSYDVYYSKLLKANVHDGLVDYKSLKNDENLNKAVAKLEEMNPGVIEDSKERLAFWLNAYNLFTLKVITDNYPIESINELHTGGRIIGHIIKQTVWDKDLFVINGKKISLNEIEHEIIRKKFDEPRIHFALVCAAVSCPPLRAEPYYGSVLDEQLNDQAKAFLTSYSRNYFDKDKKIAYLSKLFDWYEEDFANNEKDLLLYVASYLEAGLANDIRKNIDSWEIEYLPYSWKLNSVDNKHLLK